MNELNIKFAERIRSQREKSLAIFQLGVLFLALRYCKEK